MKTLLYILVTVLVLHFFILFMFQFATIKQNEKKRFIFISFMIMAICLLFIAYFTDLGPGSDMSRYELILNSYRDKNLFWVSKYGFYSNTIVTNIYFWIIAQIGNDRLLYVSSTLFILANIFYIVYKETEYFDLDISTYALYIILIFSVASFSSILTGVRQNWMLSIFAVVVYREFRLNRKDKLNYFLYFISVMIHTQAIFLLMIRFLLVLKNKKIKYIFLIWTLCIPFANLFLRYGGVIAEAVNKLFIYEDESYDFRIIFFKMLLTCMFYYFLLVKNKSSKCSYYEMYEMFLIFSIGSLPVQHLFSRQVNALIYLSLPLISMFKKSKKNNFWRIFTILMSIICTVLLLYQVVFMFNYWRFNC